MFKCKIIVTEVFQLKKKLLITFLLLILSATIPLTFAEAKPYSLENEFVKNLKKGTLPNAVGAVGLPFHKIYDLTDNIREVGMVEELVKFQIINDQLIGKQIDPHDIYFFTEPVNNRNATVQSIERTYYYSFSRASVIKKLGPSYKAKDYHGNTINKTPVFKVGQYYAIISIRPNEPFTHVVIGTKRGILEKTNYQKIYR